MYQVKIFQGKPKKIEEELNEFFKNHQTLEIITMKQVSMSVSTIVITIIYRT